MYVPNGPVGTDGDDNADKGEPNEFVSTVPVPVLSCSRSVALAKWRSSAIASIDVEGAGDIEPDCNDVIEEEDAVK